MFNGIKFKTSLPQTNRSQNTGNLNTEKTEAFAQNEGFGLKYYFSICITASASRINS